MSPRSRPLVASGVPGSRAERVSYATTRAIRERRKGRRGSLESETSGRRVEMFVDQIGQRIETGFTPGREGVLHRARSACPRDPRRPRDARRHASFSNSPCQSVPATGTDDSLRRQRARRRRRARVRGESRSRLERAVVKRRVTWARTFSRWNTVRTGRRPRPSTRPGAFDVVVDATEHLVAAAQSEHGAARRRRVARARSRTRVRAARRGRAPWRAFREG